MCSIAHPRMHTHTHTHTNTTTTHNHHTGESKDEVVIQRHLYRRTKNTFAYANVCVCVCVCVCVRCAETHALTCVTGGTRVSCPVAGTTEAVPGLFTTPTVFTVVGHTSVRERDRGRERERERERERDCFIALNKEITPVIGNLWLFFRQCQTFHSNGFFWLRGQKCFRQACYRSSLPEPTTFHV